MKIIHIFFNEYIDKFIIFVLFLYKPNIRSYLMNNLKVDNDCMKHLHNCMVYLHNMYGMSPQPVWYATTNFCGGWSIQLFFISYKSNLIHLMILMYFSKKPPYPKYTLMPIFFLYVIYLMVGELFSTSSMVRLSGLARTHGRQKKKKKLSKIHLRTAKPKTACQDTIYIKISGIFCHFHKIEIRGSNDPICTKLGVYIVLKYSLEWPNIK